jgi:hypothetical protein
MLGSTPNPVMGMYNPYAPQGGVVASQDAQTQFANPMPGGGQTMYTPSNPMGGQGDMMAPMQMMMSMMSMMMQMMQTILSLGDIKSPHKHSKIEESETPEEEEVVDESGDTPAADLASRPWKAPTGEINFNKDDSIQARQHELLYGLDDTIDENIDILDTTDPETPEAKQAKTTLTSQWEKAGGDKKSLNEYTKLLQLRGLNTKYAELKNAEKPDQTALDKIMEQRKPIIAEIEKLQGKESPAKPEDKKEDNKEEEKK